MVTDGIFTLCLVTACYHVLVARATYNSLKAIAELMSELFSSGQARNLFIYGKPGTGKTLCTTHLLDEINEHAAAAL